MSAPGAGTKTGGPDFDWPGTDRLRPLCHQAAILVTNNDRWVRGGKMKSWYARLPDWRMVLAWLVLTFLATVIYFFPVARLVEAFAD